MLALSTQDLLLILVVAVLVLLPGAVIARAGGLRGWTSVGAAPLLGYGVAATAGPLSSALGINWSPLTMLGATAVLAGGGWLVHRRGRQREARTGTPGPATSATHAADRRGDRVIAAGVLAAAVIGAVTIVRGLGGLDAVHQGWDAGFHANAIRFISDTGDAAPEALRDINNYEDDTFFYPNAQHVLTSIAGQLTGAPIPSLLNTQMLLLPGIAGLGLAVLVRAFGGRVALAASVPLVLASFNGFPYDLVSRGPLLPYATSVAMIPAFLALLDRTLTQRKVSFVVLTGVAAAGLLAVHTSAALTATIFTVPLLVHRWRGRRGVVRRTEIVTLCGVGAVGAVAGLPFVLGALAVGMSGQAVDWPAYQSTWEAIAGLLILRHGDSGPQLLLVGLLVVGAFRLREIRGLWWWLAAPAVCTGLFVAVSSTDAPVIEALTQPWWNDRWRFLALVILGLALVAANGVVVVGGALAGALRRRLGDRAVPRRTVLGGAMMAVFVVFGVSSNSFYMAANEARVNANYQGGPMVTPAEQTAMRALARIAGPDGRVMNDPGDGSTWMYALEGVQPIFGHVVDPVTFGTIGPDQQLLLSAFHCLDSSPAVRELVDRYDIQYVFTGQGYLRDHWRRIPGLRELRLVDSLELLYARDGTAIYRIRLGALAPASADGLACEDVEDGRAQPRIATEGSRHHAAGSVASSISSPLTRLITVPRDRPRGV